MLKPLCLCSALSSFFLCALMFGSSAKNWALEVCSSSECGIGSSNFAASTDRRRAGRSSFVVRQRRTAYVHRWKRNVRLETFGSHPLFIRVALPPKTMFVFTSIPRKTWSFSLTVPSPCSFCSSKHALRRPVLPSCVRA